MVFSVPDSVLSIIAKATRRNPSDIYKAVEQAYRHVRELPEFDSLVESLVKQALRSLIHDSRHTMNTAMKCERGCYGGDAKVKAGASESANRLYLELYNYHVAGTVLGELLGGKLEGIADSEEAKANGHGFNAKLLRELNPMVPEGVRVRDAVKLTKLKLIFERLGKEGWPLAQAGE